MPRLFVNSMANFVIHGGVVSFTLQDQAMRSEDGQPRPAPPETVADIVMREQDFATLVSFFNQHIAAFEAHAGRKLGTLGQQPGDGPDRTGGAGAAPAAGGLRIRPREG